MEAVQFNLPTLITAAAVCFAIGWLWLINAGCQVVGCTAMGGILGSWK